MGVNELKMREALERFGAKSSDVAVVYDLSPADTDLAIRSKLIEMGWTPPGQQPAAVVELTDDEIEAAAGDTLFEEELEMLHRVLAALRAKQGGAA